MSSSVFSYPLSIGEPLFLRPMLFKNSTFYKDGSLVLLLPNNFAAGLFLMADISLNIACKELKIA